MLPLPKLDKNPGLAEEDAPPKLEIPGVDAVGAFKL
jgi:hypothetical protein